MSVVVEQTLPFNNDILDLHNPSRWNHLFPLIRPDVKAVQTSKGHSILVNEAATKSKYVRIAAVVKAGNFSSKLLDDSNVAAIVSESPGASDLSARDIQQEIESKSGEGQALVVVRKGTDSHAIVHSESLIEVVTSSELQQDHVLHLLTHASESTRSSFLEMPELLRSFINGVRSARSRFHTEKIDGNPAVLRAEGASGCQKAKEVVAKDLENVLKASSGQQGDVVYSVHYSDINGLSRLENYILAKEIAQYLG